MAERQHCQISYDYFQFEYLSDLKYGQRAFFLDLTFVAIKKRTWKIDVNWPYLVNHFSPIGLSEGTIRRNFKILSSVHLLRKLARKRDRGVWLINPLLLRQVRAQNMAYYSDAITLIGDRNAYLRAKETDQNDQFTRSKRSVMKQNLCLKTDQNDQQYYIRSSLENGTPRQRCPNGQDFERWKEGSHLTVDDIEKNRAKMLAQVKTMIGEEEKPLVEMGFANKGPELH